MKTHLLIAALLAVLAMSACGGGGGGGTVGGGGTNPITPPAPSLTILNSTLPLGLSGGAYTATLSVTGGTAPYKWDGSLTTGLQISQDGKISGTLPEYAGGQYPLTVRVTDSSVPALTGTKNFTIDIYGLVDTVRLVPQVGVDTSSSFIQAAGGVEPISWQLTGTLPPGVTFIKNPASVTTREYQLTGKPTQAGTYSFSITATDSAPTPRSKTRSFTLQVEPAALNLGKTNALPVAVVGKPYSYQFNASGGTTPFQWIFSQISGALPSGLNFDKSTGTISGTPTAPGYAGFSITVTDASAPNVQSDSWTYYWLLVSAKDLSGRNDSIATAVHIYPGTYVASISPYTDGNGNAQPDQDYFELTSTAGSTVSFAAGNEVPDPVSRYRISVLDPVIEIVDANGQRLSTCNDPLNDNPPAGSPIPIDSTPNGFDDVCMNWAGHGNSFGQSAVGARLDFKVPGTSGNVTYYLHVFDWRGDARPDMGYQLVVTQH